MDELAKQFRQTTTPTKKLTQEFEAAKRAAAALKQSHEAETSKLDELRRQLGAAGISTKKLASHSRDLSTEIASANKNLADQKTALAAVERMQEKVAQASERMNRRLQLSMKLAGGGAAGGIAFGAQRLVTGFTDSIREVERAKGELATLGGSKTLMPWCSAAMRCRHSLRASLRMPSSAPPMTSNPASAR